MKRFLDSLPVCIAALVLPIPLEDGIKVVKRDASLIV